MKTDNSQSIRRNRWFRLASSLMATLFLITCIASCSEEDISGDITGKYGNLTGADDTVITIGTRGDGYTNVHMKISEAVNTLNGTELSRIFRQMLSLVPTEKKSEKFISAEPMP